MTVMRLRSQTVSDDGCSSCVFYASPTSLAKGMGSKPSDRCTKRNVRMKVRLFAPLLISILSGCMTASLVTSPGQDVSSANYNAAMAKQGVEYYCGSGQCDVPPSLITAAAPVYPPEALSNRQAGQVSVLFDIEPDGHTSNLRIESSTSQEFASVSLDAIKLWRFKPAMLDGRPVKIGTRQIFPFTLH